MGAKPPERHAMKAAAQLALREVKGLILLIRGQRVMLDRDLARLYGVSTKALKQAVKRHTLRFPKDFAFVLDRQEVANLKSQIVTSSWGGDRRAPPMAFTERNFARLSNVLRRPQDDEKFHEC